MVSIQHKATVQFLLSLPLLLIPISIAQSTLEVPEPHKHFPKQISRLVQEANSISRVAESVDAKSYPTINIHSWIRPESSTEEDRQTVVNQVLEQAISTGSFNIIGHRITLDLFDRLENSTETFFSRELDEKIVYSNGNHKHGYVANQQEGVAGIHKTDNVHEQKDLREIYSVLYPPEYPENIKGPSYLQDTLDEYLEQLQPVELALKQIFTAALATVKDVKLPLSYLHDAESGSTGLLRANRYPTMPEDYDDANRLLAHSDFSTLTILHSTERGLEEIRDGRWVEVPIYRGQLHVAIGEVYTMWSNGLFANNVHRVSSRAVNDRLSFAYFFGQGQTKGEGIEPVCSKEEVARFPRVSTTSHLKEYFEPLTGANL